MSTESSSPEGDTEDVSDPYGRLTISAFGPVVQEQTKNDAVSIATKTEAQVERRVRDADDLETVTNDRNPGKKMAAAKALFGDVDELRFPNDDPTKYDFASDWTVQVEGDVADWKRIADEEADSPGLANGNSPADVLERLTRRETVGGNALTAALDLARDEGEDDVHDTLMARYLDRFGPSREDFEDWLENQGDWDSEL